MLDTAYVKVLLTFRNSVSVRYNILVLSQIDVAVGNTENEERPRARLHGSCHHIWPSEAMGRGDSNDALLDWRAARVNFEIADEFIS